MKSDIVVGWVCSVINMNKQDWTEQSKQTVQGCGHWTMLTRNLRGAVVWVNPPLPKKEKKKIYIHTICPRSSDPFYIGP